MHPAPNSSTPQHIHPPRQPAPKASWDVGLYSAVRPRSVSVVDGTRVFIVPLKNITVADKGTVNFVCESSHPDTTVKWYKNGAELVAGASHHRIYGDGQQCLLTIDTVGLDDGGDYCCRMVDSDAATKAVLTVKGNKRKKGPKPFNFKHDSPPESPKPPIDIDSKATITINQNTFLVDADDLETICHLGKGAYGIVEKVRHRGSGTILAVKRITCTVNSLEQKRLLMDLDVSMRTGSCPYTVSFYGALFREGDVWICMEVMDTSLDKFYKMVYDKEKTVIPEDILGKIANTVVKALHYLQTELKVIHRDVKPSNILINRSGEVKICDFGISGRLVDSVAKTMDAGCKPYMAVRRFVQTVCSE
ncbi:Dual specificity mitogen-activated protein kinase kinase 6 [Lamellibrachia satsuma]|nr:Dual specificity mitogen-activated protein kinase kinase 6 [Lamellibrachia satsuma]